MVAGLQQFVVPSLALHVAAEAQAMVKSSMTNAAATPSALRGAFAAAPSQSLVAMRHSSRIPAAATAPSEPLWLRPTTCRGCARRISVLGEFP
jgi:hypothetical protein